MRSKKGFIMLTGGVCFMMSALATATVVADEVNSKDKAAAVVQVSQGAIAPAFAEVSQNAKAPLIAGVPARPTLADIWDKHQCFVVLLGNCL